MIAMSPRVYGSARSSRWRLWRSPTSTTRWSSVWCRMRQDALRHGSDDVAARWGDDLDASVRNAVLPPSGMARRRVRIALTEEQQCLGRDVARIEVEGSVRVHGRGNTTEDEPIDAPPL